MKDEVKFENSILKEDAATYKRKILTLELANKSSTRNAKKLKSQVRQDREDQIKGCDPAVTDCDNNAA